MSLYKCGHCGFEGYCYGTPFMGGSSGGGVSAPWCPRCGMNNKLVPVKTSSTNRNDVEVWVKRPK